MDIYDHSQNYLPILVFIVVALGFACLMSALPFIISKVKPYKAKISPYECGFEGTGNPRSKFNVKFYLVAILFIIFDVEILFLVPWAIHMESLGMLAFWNVMAFLLIVTLGFIYEWRKGVLDE